MKWYEIVFNLLDDPMIECCGMDGLWDEIPNVIIENGEYVWEDCLQ